jgi:rhamnosyltransferase
MNPASLASPVQMKVWAVCVTFNPEISIFAQVIAATRPQVEGIVVVDNGSMEGNRQNVIDLCRQAALKMVTLSTNQGLASALNVGISLALSEGSTDVLLLDHDSVPESGMVAAMAAAKEALTVKGERVGALGARMIDARTGSAAPFVRFGALGLERTHCGDSVDQAIPADMLCTSGSLISASVLKIVGLMDGALFVDHVDTDWCLRASAAGFRLFGVCGAGLSHRLGDEIVHITFPVARSIHVHSPLRIYYFVRNSLRLYSQPYAPWRWIVPDAVRLLRLVIFYCVFIPKRREYFGAVWRGVRDGCRELRA